MVRLRSSPSYTPLTSLGIPTLSHANSSPFYSAVTFHRSEFHAPWDGASSHSAAKTQIFYILSLRMAWFLTKSVCPS